MFDKKLMAFYENEIECSLTGMALILLALLPLFMFLGPFPTDAALTLIGLMFVWRSGRKREWAWCQEPWLRIMFILWLFLMLRSVTAYDWLDSLTKSFVFIRYIIFTAALQHWLLIKPVYRRLLFWGMLFACTFVVFDTLIQYFVGHDLFGRPKWMADRLTGPLRRPRVGLTMAWLGVPVMAYGLNQLLEKKILLKQKLLWASLALGVFAVGVLSGDRGGLVEMMLALFGTLLFWKAFRKKIALFLVGFVLLGGLVFWSDPAALHRQISLTSQKMSHFWDSDYGVVYKGGWHTFLDNPIVGVGTKQYKHICPQHHHFQAKTDEANSKSYTVDSTFPCGHHPHNLYLEWLAEGGLIGFFLFFSGIGCAFSRLWRYRDSWGKDPWLLGCAMVLVTRLMPMLPSGSMHVVWAACPIWLMLGLLLGVTEEKRRSCNKDI